MNSDKSDINLYKKVYIQYAPMLMRFAGKFVSNLYMEDIIQDVFLKFWNNKIFSLPENEIKKLLFASVRNGCIDHLRKESLSRKYVDTKGLKLALEELNYYNDAEELFMQENLLDIVNQKLNELAPRKQEIFRLAYYEGMKTAEIASVLNISPRTVENQLYRTIVYLREHISKEQLYILLLVLFHS